MNLKRLITFAILCLAAVGVDAKNFYRFKDSNGRLVVKDYLPNSALKSGYDIINEDGRLIERVEPALTPEQVAAKRKREQQEAEQREKELEARRHDQLLLRQYRTIDDIKRTEKNQLASLQINISIIEGHNKSLNRKLTELQSEAADYERQGKTVPSSTLKQIKATKEQIQENNESKEGYQNQVKAIKQQFRNDLVRFKELKARNVVQGYSRQEELDAATQVICTTEKSCERSWKLAQIFAHENASNKLEIVTDSLIISSKPQQSDQLGMSITRIPDDNDQMQIVMQVLCFDSEAGQKLCSSKEVTQLKEDFIQYISQNES
ncbi:hypothetical protein [Kangiella sediminilitoris]|uniref:DUF4124 domain-containing protein n=1 Tax=Kangiella sediminilitoris TaxID=1144748 RepID=A0A1B3B8I7_9GAMM|nr:hypothetical protein [Kangiella sediminilitoris]AOE49113.1 hypothetical protein KS2013_388 [Kangiella sediminilitoris]